MLRTVLSVTAACAAVVAPVITDALSQGAQANIYVQPARTLDMPGYARTVDYPAAAPTATPQYRGYPRRLGGGSGRGSYRGGSYQPQFWQQTYQNGNYNTFAVPGW